MICVLETEDPLVFGRLQRGIPETECLSATVFPRFPHYRSNGSQVLVIRNAYEAHILSECTQGLHP